MVKDQVQKGQEKIEKLSKKAEEGTLERK